MAWVQPLNKMAELIWQNGTIRYPAYLWKSHTRRRIPRLLIEPRVKEVGIEVFKDDNYVVFKETQKTPSQLWSSESELLEFYKNRYLLPGNIPYHGDLFDYFDKGKSIVIFFHNDRFFYNRT